MIRLLTLLKLAKLPKWYLLFSSTIFEHIHGHFHTVFKNAAVGMVIVRAKDLKFMQVNESFCKFLGYTREELIGIDVMAVTYPEDVEISVNMVKLLCRSKNGKTQFEKRYVRKDGRVVWGQTNISVIRNLFGHPRFFITQVLDVDDRKRWEDKLRLQSSALEAAANGIVITDVHGKIVWVNHAMQILTGYAYNELVCQNSRILKSGSHNQAFYQHMWNTILSGKIWHSEIENKRKDGSFYHEEIVITPVKNSEGKITNFIAIKQDISHRILSANLLIEKTNELERSNAELQKFAYIASHDLQEPLRMIASFVELLSKKYHGKLDAQADEYINLIINGTECLQAMVDGMLEYSRVHTQTNDLLAFESQDALNIALQNIAIVVQERNAKIIQTTMPRIVGDKVQIIRVFQNLLLNAIKFTPKERQPIIKISAGFNDKEDVWVFAVQDNGIGIEEKYQDKVFVLFSRLNSKSEYPGTGIGLSVCQKIIQRHCGKIWVESKIDNGSTFFFSIPS